MHSDADVTRIVQSWLRTDEHESADRVLDDVLALLDTTPQRRPRWLAQRSAQMNTFAKLAMAAAAVVVVAIVGINLLPSEGSSRVGGGSSPTSSPSPSASPAASPEPAAVFPPAGKLAVGRYAMTKGGVPFTIGVSTTDWESNGDFGINKGAGVGPTDASFIFWLQTPVGVFSDPCNGTKGPPVGLSAAKLASAVTAVPGTDVVAGPRDVTVGGHPAKRVVIRIREDIGCSPNDFYLWYAPRADLARYATQIGSTISVWIVDVDGKLVWIDGETYKGAGLQPQRDIERIIDSIQFE
jgi:hypothetical protein